MNSTNKKLVFVVNDAAFFLSHRLPLALAARADGYQVHVATPQSSAVADILSAGLEFHPIPFSRSGTSPVSELKAMIALYRLFRRIKPDIAHLVTIKPVLYGGIAGRLARVPAIVSAVTGLGYVFVAQGIKASILRAGVKSVYRLALGQANSRVIFQNLDDRLAFLKDGLVDAAHSLLIKGSGVDMSQYVPTPEPDGTPLIVLASRMLWDKGVGEFVEAARLLRQAGIKARFVLVGDSDSGNPAVIPTEQLKSWQESSMVEWWGRCDDMPAVFAQSHIVCLPSYREGLPKVLIEAAACGRPIVTTDVPGCREIVRQGENGLLVPVRDATALAMALRQLIENPQQRPKMGTRGREIAVAEFSVERVIKQTRAAYRKLMEESDYRLRYSSREIQVKEDD